VKPTVTANARSVTANDSKIRVASVRLDLASTPGSDGLAFGLT
jgi:hypothetical protein